MTSGNLKKLIILSNKKSSATCQLVPLTNNNYSLIIKFHLSKEWYTWLFYNLKDDNETGSKS